MDYATRIEDFHAGMLPSLLGLFGTFFPEGNRLLTEGYHDWLYRQNPFGTAKAVFVCADGEWAGFMALVPVALRRRGEGMKAYFVVNVLVDPGHQGRNLFGRMITAACELAQSENAALLGHPNAAALRFWQRKKMHFQGELRPALALPGPAGWSIQSRRATSFDRLRGAASAVDRAIAQSDRWKVAATPEYLEWRFFRHPTNSYAVQVLEQRGAPIGVQVSKRMKPGVHLFIDHWVEPAGQAGAMAKLPVFTACFMPDDRVRELGALAWTLPWKKRLPVFLTHFARPVVADEASEIALSASDF